MKTLLLALAITLPLTANAEFLSGNKLLQLLEGKERDQEIALAYIAGSADSSMGVISCPPAGVTLGQIRDITKRLLVEVPEERHKSADSFIWSAMRATWPCKKQNTPKNQNGTV